MAIPEPLRQSALEAVEQYCANRIPPHVRDQIRLEASIRGNAVMIVERRPLWRDDIGREWSAQRIARFLYEPATATWSLWWADRNERWLKYPPQKPTGNVEILLAAVDADQLGCFYG
jgi:hypothetical protein